MKRKFIVSTVPIACKPFREQKVTKKIKTKQINLRNVLRSQNDFETKHLRQ